MLIIIIRNIDALLIPLRAFLWTGSCILGTKGSLFTVIIIYKGSLFTCGQYSGEPGVKQPTLGLVPAEPSCPHGIPVT